MMAVDQRQKPDAAFVGTVNVVTFGIATGESKALNVACDSARFDDVFEIPTSLLRQKKYESYVYVDLVQPGAAPVLFPGAKNLLQEAYSDAEPWIVVPLLEIASPR